MKTYKDVFTHEGAIALRAVVGANATSVNIAVVATRMVNMGDFDDIVEDATPGGSFVGRCACGERIVGCVVSSVLPFWVR